MNEEGGWFARTSEVSEGEEDEKLIERGKMHFGGEPSDVNRRNFSKFQIYVSSSVQVVTTPGRTSSAMAPRLLSFLSKIETALIEQGATIVAKPMQRSVSYQKGLARLSFADGGAISLQNFTLADGQICVKASLTWAGREGQVVHAIYPHADSHDWSTSADGVALAWMSGPASALPMPRSEGALMSTNRFAAVS